LHRSIRSLAKVLVLTILSTTFSSARTVNAAVTKSDPAAPTAIVIGFVGGFVHSNNPHHGPVQLAQRIRESVPPSTYVQVFENRRRRQAHDLILRLLDSNRDGTLSADEKSRARIIIFGHSWGASAAVLLARDLRAQQVPVLLTVQVDSVAKPWQDDSVIPDNVVESVNFYQTAGILHGRRQITAADPAKTRVLGNYQIDYKKNPIQCPEASWMDRFFTPGHMQSECDHQLWSRIQAMVEQRISLQTSSAAMTSNSVPPAR
jgi:pimeloyl-ACP methyl ester carboxylesterase